MNHHHRPITSKRAIPPVVGLNRALTKILRTEPYRGGNDLHATIQHTVGHVHHRSAQHACSSRPSFDSSKLRQR